MKKGQVKFFNSAKGFGFIKDLETGVDVFVHATGLNEDITEGDEVAFDVQEGKETGKESKYTVYNKDSK